jgi:hypothetical protein
MSILVEKTPNPLAMKFTAPVHMFDGNDSYPVHKGDVSDYPILNQLLTIDGVDHVFGFQTFITVIKESEADWNTLIPVVTDIMTNHGYDKA